MNMPGPYLVALILGIGLGAASAVAIIHLRNRWRSDWRAWIESLSLLAVNDPRLKLNISGTARKPASCACNVATNAATHTSRHVHSARSAARARSACSRPAERRSSTAT